MPDISPATVDTAAPQAPATRPVGCLSGLRKASAATSVMLLAQYGLGMGLSRYANVPAADHGAGLPAALGRALTRQPTILAAHTALGLLVLLAGVNVLTRAVRARHPHAIAAAAGGLAAITAAAVNGAAFVSNGQHSASIAMAVLTGVALLCYLTDLLMADPGATSSRG